MTEDTSPENLRKFLESDDPAMRRMGLSMAKGSGVPEELLPTILGLYMWDDDKSVRTAARTMFFKHAPAEIQAKVKAWWKPSYRTLSISGDKFPEAVRPLLEAFKSQDDFAEIVWRRAEPLTEALLDRWSAGRRDHAAWALGKIGDARAVEPLIKALGDKNGFISLTAAEALAKIAEKYIEGEEKDNIIKFLKSGDQGMAQMGASMLKGILEKTEVLGKIDDVRAVEPLIKMLEEGNTNAAYALGEFGDERAVEPLIELLDDDDYVVRLAAAYALGEIGDARAVEPLINALEDQPNWSSREAAKEALKKIGHEVK